MPRKPKISVFGGGHGSIFFTVFKTKSRKATSKNMKFKGVRSTEYKIRKKKGGY